MWVSPNCMGLAGLGHSGDMGDFGGEHVAAGLNLHSEQSRRLKRPPVSLFWGVADHSQGTNPWPVPDSRSPPPTPHPAAPLHQTPAPDPPPLLQLHQPQVLAILQDIDCFCTKEDAEAVMEVSNRDS